MIRVPPDWVGAGTREPLDGIADACPTLAIIGGVDSVHTAGRRRRAPRRVGRARPTARSSCTPRPTTASCTRPSGPRTAPTTPPTRGGACWPSSPRSRADHPLDVDDPRGDADDRLVARRVRRRAARVDHRACRRARRARLRALPRRRGAPGRAASSPAPCTTVCWRGTRRGTATSRRTGTARCPRRPCGSSPASRSSGGCSGLVRRRGGAGGDRQRRRAGRPPSCSTAWCAGSGATRRSPRVRCGCSRSCRPPSCS